VQGKNASKM